MNRTDNSITFFSIFPSIHPHRNAVYPTGRPRRHNNSRGGGGTSSALTAGSGGEDSDAYYSDGGYRRRRDRLPPQHHQKSKYSLHVEYPSQPGHRGLISRSKDGKFILDEEDDEDEDDGDDGGFGVALPPNRFRTRSVAIVAGYSPERLYSNMPPGAHVVESGVYKVGADRLDRSSEPIYWRQVVYGASVGRGASSDGSGTLPRPQAMVAAMQAARQQQVAAHMHYLPPPQQQQQVLLQQQQQAASRQVSGLGEEDLRRLRALERQPQSTTSLDQHASQGFFDQTSSTSRLIRTSNLELLRPGQSSSKLRSSSPLNQGQAQAPLQAPTWASPIAGGGGNQNSSELSSITHRERSLPSTLLTNPLSSLSTLPNLTSENTASTRSLRGLQQRSSELQTIPEQTPADGEPPPAYSPAHRQVRADVHPQLLQQQQQLQMQQQLQQQQHRRGKMPQQEDPYFQRPTYLNADAMFPNYALNYPAPIHLQGHHHTGTISPSRQYPPVQVPPDSYWQSLYVQPMPTPAALAASVSSPPPSYASPKHEYENTRYFSAQQQQQQQQQQQPAPPLPAPRRRPRTVSVEGAVGMRQHRESTVVDGRLVQQQQQQQQGEDRTSLVSEVLDAEVTALTNSSSSPGSEKGGGGGKSASGKSKSRLQEVKEKLAAAAAASAGSGGGGGVASADSTSSGIGSKNTSQHQTSSSSGGSQQQQQQQFLSPDSKAPLEPIFERQPQPFYENWPPSAKQQQQQQQQHNVDVAHYHGYHYMQPLSVVTGGGATGTPGEGMEEELFVQPEQPLPPLTPHLTSGMPAKPQTASARRVETSTVATLMSGGEDTASLDTPPSRAGMASASRPGSAHSAPMLDVSIDRHYEFDSRTPTSFAAEELLTVDDLDPDAISRALPRQWNRPYLG